jgi:hypothetical protein
VTVTSAPDKQVVYDSRVPSDPTPWRAVPGGWRYRAATEVQTSGPVRSRPAQEDM